LHELRNTYLARNIAEASDRKEGGGGPFLNEEDFKTRMSAWYAQKKGGNFMRDYWWIIQQAITDEKATFGEQEGMS